jgi:Carboxypeptidase regulatory-like domain
VKCTSLFRIGALVLGLCGLHGMVNGQSSEQGQIRGTVSDSRGSVIPGANVTLTDVGANVSEKATANDHGLYVFTALRAANYRMLIESPGFRRWRRPALLLT